MHTFLSALVLILSTACVAFIAHSQSLAAEPFFDGYIGVLLPVALCLVAFLAGMCASSAMENSSLAPSGQPGDMP